MDFDEYTAGMNHTTTNHFVDANKLVEWLQAVRQDWHDDWDFQKVYAVDYILTHIEEMLREDLVRHPVEGGNNGP